MNALPRRRRGSTIALAAASAAVLLLAACGSKSPGGNGALGPVSGPVTSPSGGGNGTPTTTPSTPVTTPPTTPHAPPPASHTYPADYPMAILQAWAAHDRTYLTLLTDATTAGQILGFGNINTHWTMTSAEGAAGSSYTMYYNAGGDYIVIRTVNELTSEHQWHAGSIETWDQMSFPAGPSDYAKKMVGGWMTGNRARMDFLGTTALTTLLLGMTPPTPDFTALAPVNMGSGIVEVEVKDTSTGTDISFIIKTANLSHHNAITGCDIGC